MPHEDPYFQLVIDDAYGRVDDQRPLLLADLPRWRDTLVDLVQEANDRLTALTTTGSHPLAEFNQVKAEFLDKRGGQVHFKRKIESRLREAKRLIDEQRRAEHAENSGNLPSKKAWRELCIWLAAWVDADDEELFASVPGHLKDRLEDALESAAR